MHEREPMRLRADEIHLRGGMQLDFARQALAVTGLNPGFEKRLAGLIALIESEDMSNAEVLAIHLYGSSTVQIKTHIVESLRKMAGDYPMTASIAV